MGSACCEAPEGAHQTQDWTRLCSVSLHLPCRLTRAKAKTWAETLRCLSKPWQKPHLLPSRWPKQVTRGGEWTVCLHSERGRVVTRQGWEFGKGYSLATTGGLGPNNRVLGRAFCGRGGTFPGEAEAAPTPGCSSGVVHCSAVPCAFGLLVGWGGCTGIPSFGESWNSFYPESPSPSPHSSPRSCTKCHPYPRWAPGGRLSEQPGARKPWLCELGKACPPGSLRLDAIRGNQPKARGSCRPAPLPAAHASG